MELLLGIDDAGRGPVIGPMALAGVIINKNQEQELKELGVKDSKLLLPVKRKKISDIIKQKYKHKIVTASPKEIDEHENLNWLEAEKTAEIINSLTKDIKEKIKIVVDCPSINPKAWQDYLVKKIKNTNNIELSCEHKADLHHPTVSAASIIAKEKREDELKQLKQTLNTDFGSGYPADPKTKKFIEKNFNNKKYQHIIRHSWNTVKKLHKNQAQKSLF
tara:strand:- start:1740 stop:2396 length:657 start_codon:yes stop_codon:yes gene_type:complete